MDVELLSKMIKELLSNHDVVGLPGVGTFVAEIVPASFSDKGYTINPPYRRLSFKHKVEEGSLLAQLYAKVNSVSEDSASELMSQFLTQLATVLCERKTVIFPELGRLRATKENNFFFVADPDLDIFPEGFALEPISLRSHSDNSTATDIQFEFQAPLAPIPALEPIQPIDISSSSEPTQADEATQPAEPIQPSEDTAPEQQPAVEEAADESSVAEPAPSEEPVSSEDEICNEEQEAEPLVSEPMELEVPAEQASQEPMELYVEDGKAVEPPTDAVVELTQKKCFRWWIPLLVLLFIAIMALLVFITLVQVAPDFIDTLLYTTEELKILYY